MATPEVPRSAVAGSSPVGASADVSLTPARGWPAVGLGVTVLLVVLATALPPLLGWDVHARLDDKDTPPLHGFGDLKVGVGTLPAIVLALLAWRWAAPLAERLPWRRLLLVGYVVALVWLLSLALVDGEPGLTRVLGNDDEYLRTARVVTDVPAMLQEFIARIPYSAAPDNWDTHIAGHPPLAFLFFIGLARIGLGGDLAAALVVTALAATTAPGVLVALRALGAETGARRAAPFLVLTPAAIFMAVSADALFAAVAAWGLATLALSASARARGRPARVMVGWAAASGLLLGTGVLLSYGLPLLGVLALAVLLAARSWWPLPVAALAALVPVLVLAALGFAWWEAYPVLRTRYFDGVASDRPTAYWWWANLAALALSAGPLLGAGAARLAQLTWTTRTREAWRRTTSDASDRVVLLLATAGFASILLADASGMSKAEVERIWLPFIPWMTLCLVLLPASWRRWGLGLQLVFALVLQHVMYTSW